MGNTLSTAQKATILVDGAPLNGNAGTIESADPTIGTIHVNSDGNYEVLGEGEGETDITASEGPRTGSLHIVVTGAPLTVDLDTPTAQ